MGIEHFSHRAIMRLKEATYVKTLEHCSKDGSSIIFLPNNNLLLFCLEHMVALSCVNLERPNCISQNSYVFIIRLSFKRDSWVRFGRWK